MMNSRIQHVVRTLGFNLCKNQRSAFGPKYTFQGRGGEHRLSIPAFCYFKFGRNSSFQASSQKKGEDNALEKFFDKVQGTIQDAGGEINLNSLGGIPRPTSVSGMPLNEILKQSPHRFQFRKDNRAWMVSMTEGAPTVEVSKKTLDEYLDEVQSAIESAYSGRIPIGKLGSIMKPASISSRPMQILKDNPDRFQLQTEGSAVYISLAKGDQDVDPVQASDTISNEILFVDDLMDLTNALTMIKQADFQEFGPEQKQLIAIDLEGDKRVELIQIASPQSVLIVDCVAIGNKGVCEALDTILNSNHYIKLTHDVRKDSMKLAKLGIKLQGVLDTQLVAEATFGYPFIGLNPFLDRLSLPSNPHKGSMAKLMNSAQEGIFSSRPIEPWYLDYAANDVSCLLKSREFIWTKFGTKAIDRLLLASSQRISDALVYGTRRPIAFDKERDFCLSSAELLRTFHSNRAYIGEPMIVDTSLGDAADLLPERLRCALASDIFQNASDIVLDVGRRPQCLIMGERKFLFDDASALVSQDDIDYIVSNLPGGFGADGRAALPDSLNRVSVIKGKHKEVLGITLRIGRSIQNVSDLLLDLLLGTDKSILILGSPSSGKTSLIRDMARQLSQTRNVVVVDKSNEIGGDGSVPHESLGLSRRIMIPAESDQQTVMIECVENHAPQAMVIDEIGQEKQVSAARTVKNRGVRMISTAHGSLCSLVSNPILNGLVGGVDSVIVGDDAAEAEEKRRKNHSISPDRDFRCLRRDSPPKLQTQRVEEPIFDIIVEVSITDRNTWKVIPDTARAVDNILKGLPYHAHVRSRDPSTGAMFFEFAGDYLSSKISEAHEESAIDLDEDESLENWPHNPYSQEITRSKQSEVVIDLDDDEVTEGHPNESLCLKQSEAREESAFDLDDNK